MDEGGGRGLFSGTRRVWCEVARHSPVVALHLQCRGHLGLCAPNSLTRPSGEPRQDSLRLTSRGLTAHKCT